MLMVGLVLPLRAPRLAALGSRQACRSHVQGRGSLAGDRSFPESGAVAGRALRGLCLASLGPVWCM